MSKCERELLTLLGKLSENGLVQIRDATAVSIAGKSQEPEGFLRFRGYAATTPDLVEEVRLE